MPSTSSTGPITTTVNQEGYITIDAVMVDWNETANTAIRQIPGPREGRREGPQFKPQCELEREFFARTDDTPAKPKPPKRKPKKKSHRGKWIRAALKESFMSHQEHYMEHIGSNFSSAARSR